jgi:hypothetical protein
LEAVTQNMEAMGVMEDMLLMEVDLANIKLTAQKKIQVTEATHTVPDQENTVPIHMDRANQRSQATHTEQDPDSTLAMTTMRKELRPASALTRITLSTGIKCAWDTMPMVMMKSPKKAKMEEDLKSVPTSKISTRGPPISTLSEI